jgi:hypothetical protein
MPVMGFGPHLFPEDSYNGLVIAKSLLTTCMHACTYMVFLTDLRRRWVREIRHSSGSDLQLTGIWYAPKKEVD